MAGLAEIKRAAGGTKVGVEEDTIRLIFAAIVTLVKQGEDVSIKGFGTFKKVHTDQRVGINPQRPGEKTVIPAKDHLKFKASPSVTL